MDPRPPVSFAPRPDTGGKNADYIRGQIESGRGRPCHDDSDEIVEDDRKPDRGPTVIAILIIVVAIVVTLIPLAILGAAS